MSKILYTNLFRIKNPDLAGYPLANLAQESTMRDKLIAVLRHGTDTEEGERPLIAGEAADLTARMQPKIITALGGVVQEAWSSRYRRAAETAVAAGGVAAQTIDALGQFPPFAPAVKPLAKATGMDTSEAFFEVEGMEKGIELGWAHGGEAITVFLRALAASNAERMLAVGHGGSLEAVAARVRGAFGPGTVLRKGEGFVLKMDGAGKLTFVAFLRR